MEFVLRSTELRYNFFNKPHCQYCDLLNKIGVTWCIKNAKLYEHWEETPMVFITLNSIEDLMILSSTLEQELIIHQGANFPILEIYDDYRE